MKIHLIRTVQTVTLLGLVALSAMFASTSGMAQEIIVDNTDVNTFRAGTWYTSSGKNPYLGDSLYNNNNGYFGWTDFSLPWGGDYDVYAWWTYHPNRSENVPYYLELGSSDATVNVNQRDPDLGGQWNLLGRFSFDTRFASPAVRVSSTNGQASADAIKLVFARETEVWPDVSCPCDEYYSRAVDKYLAWGGSMIPQGYVGGATTILCDDPADTLELDTSYTTTVNGITVSLTLSTFISHRGFADCTATVISSLHPSAPVYSRSVDSTAADWVDACRASVRDFCVSDPSPP